MEEAASIPLVGLTIWQTLIEKANLKKKAKAFYSGWFVEQGMQKGKLLSK
jgi:NADPH:quinone reductase-like Zn-dependent oxidoreductase